MLACCTHTYALKLSIGKAKVLAAQKSQVSPRVGILKVTTVPHILKVSCNKQGNKCIVASFEDFLLSVSYKKVKPCTTIKCFQAELASS